MVHKKLDNGKFITYKDEEYMHDYYPDKNEYILYDKEDEDCRNPIHKVTQADIDGMTSVHSWCLVDYVLFEALSIESEEIDGEVVDYCKVRRRSSELPNKILMSRVMVIWSAYCINGVTSNRVYYCKSRKEADEYVNCSYPYYLEEMANGNKMINFMGTYKELKGLHKVLDDMYGQRIKIIKSVNDTENSQEVSIELSIDYLAFTLSLDYWGIVTLSPNDRSGNGRMVNIMKYLQKNGL